MLCRSAMAQLGRQLMATRRCVLCSNWQLVGSWGEMHKMLLPGTSVVRCRSSGKQVLYHHMRRRSSRDNGAHQRFRRTRQILLETKDRVKEMVGEIRLKENVMTVPNCLCITRIIVSPILVFLIVRQNFEWAVGLFVFAGVTDLLDGYIARNFKNQQSMFGSFLDPLADKLLILGLMGSLTFQELIPISLTALILTRDALLIAAGCYVRFASLPPPRTLSQFFDVTMATARLSPTLVSKVNTGVQLVMVGVTLMSPLLGFTESPYLQVLFYFTAASTVVSGLSYITSKNTYKFFTKTKS